MSSGVCVSDSTKQAFDTIKRLKSYRYLILHIQDEKNIEVELQGKREADYDDFFRDLTACGPLDCRYGVYDYQYTHQCEGTNDASTRERLVLISWCPDTARIKKKMLYSASFDILRKTLVGIQKCFMATDAYEASAEAVEEKLRSTDRA